jgi:hypothetical protein
MDRDKFFAARPVTTNEIEARLHRGRIGFFRSRAGSATANPMPNCLKLCALLRCRDANSHRKSGNALQPES